MPHFASATRRSLRATPVPDGIRYARTRLAVTLVLVLAGCSESLAPEEELPSARARSDAGGALYEAPATIDTSGRADVTAKLNAFFASVPDGSTITFPRGARYRVEGVLRLDDRHSLTIEGNDALFFARTEGHGVRPPGDLAHRWPRGRRHWMIVGGRGIVVRNLRVKGAHPRAGVHASAYVPALEGQHGFDLRAVRDVVLEHVTVTDVYGDFVYVGRDGDTWASDIVIRDSHFERSGRQGIAIVAGRQVQIHRNYIGHVRRSSLDLEPNGARDGAVEVRVLGNTFGPGRLLFLAAGGGPGQVRSVIVGGNTLVGKSLTVAVETPTGSRRSGFRFVNNSSDATFGSSGPLMSFERVDGLLVRGNRQAFAADRAMTAVRVKESCAVEVAGNHFTGAARHLERDRARC